MVRRKITPDLIPSGPRRLSFVPECCAGFHGGDAVGIHLDDRIEAQVALVDRAVNWFKKSFLCLKAWWRHDARMSREAIVERTTGETSIRLRSIWMAP